MSSAGHDTYVNAVVWNGPGPVFVAEDQGLNSEVHIIPLKDGEN